MSEHVFEPMSRDALTAATHGGLLFHNPLAPERVDDVIGRLPLSVGDRAVDIGCGPGELLLRLAHAHGIEGLGIDKSPLQIEQARRRAEGTRLQFTCGDASAFGGAQLDLAACLGSLHAVGGLHPGLGRLAQMVRPGGWVLIADGFWRRAPETAYLEVLGATAGELPDRTGLLLAGLRYGLTTTYAAEATEEDWDRYEWTLIHNGESHAHPDVRAWAARARTRYAGPGGRDTLGFALVLMRRDG